MIAHAEENRPGVTGAVDPSGRTIADLLGQITWLMTRSAEHRGMFISDLEWLVMPAILNQQFRLFYHEEQPKAAVFWAWTTPDVYNRVKALPQKKLQMAEWTGGSELVVVDAIAPFGDRAILIREIEPQLRAMKGDKNG